MRFKFLPHTADIKFQSFGNTLEESFANAGLALTNIICKDKIKEKQKRKIVVKGKDRERLLYEYLEEFLYLFEVGDFILSKVENVKIVSSKNGKFYTMELRADLIGDDLSKYEAEADIKAITYHEMKIFEEKGKFICQVVVDV